jgi:carbon-monoxide dehydrogenase large subunit
MDKFGIGQPVRRKEDVRLLTGRGTYTDDISRPGEAHMVVVRSPHAHARILSIDTAAAGRRQGVLAVLTGHDADADGIGRFPVMVDVPGKDGTKLFAPPREMLQTRKVRMVGDPVAIVIAGTRSEAQDAAELVAVDYEALPAVTGTAEALGPGCAAAVGGARQQSLRAVGQRAGGGDRGGLRPRRTDRRVELVNNRLVGNPMEPRVAIGEYDRAEDRYTLHSPTQGVVRVRDGLASAHPEGAEGELRVVSPDVGGGFGLRGKIMSRERHGAVGGEAASAGR